MSGELLHKGVVYTETLVHAPAEQFVQDAPYQLAIIELPNGRRVTGRIEGERASIGDSVHFVELRGQVPFFRRDA